MARAVRARIEARSPRLRLPGRKEPYWQTIERGLAVGYHRPLRGGTGAWWGRLLVEGEKGKRYVWTALAAADDYSTADGETVLNWAQAQAAARAWAAKQTRSGPLTVETACREYVEDLRARKGERPAKEMLGRFRKHLIPALGSRQLADLTATEFRGWFNGLVKGDDEDAIRQSKDTANRLLGSVKAAFNLAFNDGRVPDDRAWRRVGAFKGVGEARKIILSEAEIQRLVNACEPGLRELAMIGAWTGARLGELTAARVRDLDAKGATLRLRGKTGAREIHLPPDAVTLLRRAASGKTPDSFLLTTATGSQWTASLHQRRFAAAVKKAGLDPEATFYSLRHSYISRALAAGVPTKAVADHCGTSMAMIDRHYAKFIPSARAEYAKLGAPTLLQIDADEKVTRLLPGAA